MQVETLKDVLHWTSEFHRHLSSSLKHCSDTSESERAKLLLNYLADHESELARVVEKFETTGDVGALNTWCYEYLDKHPIVRHQHSDKQFDGLDTTQIIDVIVEQHKQVIDLYRYLFSRADTQTIKDLMESLRALEEHEAMRMVHTSNRFEDL